MELFLFGLMLFFGYILGFLLGTAIVYVGFMIYVHISEGLDARR